MIDRVDDTAGTATTVGTLEPLAVGRRDAARLCGLSVAAWDRLRRNGATPTPMVERRDATRRPRTVLWSVADLRAWVLAGRLGDELGHARAAKAHGRGGRR